MFPAHITVHHEFHRKGGRLTGLEGHRTDDGGGWSAPLLYFNVRGFGKYEGLVTGIFDFKSYLNRSA
jgi:hypothetical protein